MKPGRLLAALGLSMLVLVLSVLAFAVMANTYKYPNLPPRWLEATLFGIFSWPFSMFNRLLPNTHCTDGYDACGGSLAAHVASAMSVVIVYIAAFYCLLTAWNRKRDRQRN